MPVTVEPRENNRVMYFELSEPWTVADLLASFERANAIRDLLYAADPAHKIHALNNMTGVREAPPGTLGARQRMPGATHPSRGEYVVVGAIPYARAILETMLKLIHVDNAKYFDTEDEGWAYLRQVMANEDRGQQST